ncbi:MAG: ATP-binding protein [Cyanobacteria bacterium P01_D01_bin.156]
MQQPFLDCLNVKQRITLGFSAALGVAILGTGIGFWAGNHYQNKAIAIDSQITEEVKLLSTLQIEVLQTRTHQQQLIPLSEVPEDFKDEYSHILKHAESINISFQALVSLGKEVLESEHRHSQYEEFLETYQNIPTEYLAGLERLVRSIDIDNINTSIEVAQTQQKLLNFTNSNLAIQFDGISDDLSELIQDVRQELSQAHQNVEFSERSRTLIICSSMLLSSVLAALLAYTISRSINIPLQAVTETALEITQNRNFDLQVNVARNDEVGTVATAFNLMVQQVNTLMEEQKKRADELEKTNQQLVSTQTRLIAQEKLASLGSLTAGIAHEIKNPLNFVNNFAELSVELVDELTEELETYKIGLDLKFIEDITDILTPLKVNVSKIEHHGKRADRIVANMLMHSRGESSHWSDININDLVFEAINFAYHGMRAKHSNFNLQFDNDYDDNLGTIYACPQDLNRVFLNIASNACYAVYQRQLNEGDDFTPLLKVRTCSQENQTEIRIRDNGTGMTPEVKDKIFNQFFTTKPAGEGTGLGLSLSYSIVVEQHNGTLDVVSEPGIYAEFVVALPKQVNLGRSLDC